MGPYAVFGNCSTKLKNEPLCLKISRFRVELKTGLVFKVNIHILVLGQLIDYHLRKKFF